MTTFPLRSDLCKTSSDEQRTCRRDRDLNTMMLLHFDQTFEHAPSCSKVGSSLMTENRTDICLQLLVQANNDKKFLQMIKTGDKNSSRVSQCLAYI